jgi:hypothetical protein
MLGRVSRTAWTLVIPAGPHDPVPPVVGAWLRDPADPAFAQLDVTRREWVRTWPWQQRDAAVAAFLAACTDYQEARLEWDPH